MRTFNIVLLSGSVLAVLGAHAAAVSIEGRWLVGGVAQNSADTTCDLRFYGEVGASSPLWATNGCRFATDSDGYFVVGASTPAGIELPSTFWVGVTPAEHTEITPRFRVAPAPFAFAAETAELVKTDVPIAVTGVARIERLATTGDAVVDDLAIASGGHAEMKNATFPYVKLTGLDLVKGSLIGIFNDAGRIPSCDYDNFVAHENCSWYVETYIRDRGFLRHDASDTRSVDASCSFDNDGFLLLAIKAEPRECPSPKLTLKVGAQQFFSEKGFSGKRFMTIPYRAGEQVEMNLVAVGGGEVPWRQQHDYTGSIGVKARLVKFGRD